MKYAPKVLSVLAVASLALLTVAWASADKKSDQSQWMKSGMAEGSKHGGHGDRGKMYGKHPGKMCDRGESGKHSKHGKHDRGGKHGSWQDPHRLAQKLSALETEIGIRSNQLDTWRDFTDALLAVMTPPSKPAKQADSGAGKDQPFWMAQRLAERAIERGDKAETLLKAIEALRGTLTADQLQKVAALESRMAGKHHGQHGHRQGPRHDRGGPSGPSGDDTAPKPAELTPPAE